MEAPNKKSSGAIICWNYAPKIVFSLYGSRKDKFDLKNYANKLLVYTRNARKYRVCIKSLRDSKI